MPPALAPARMSEKTRSRMSVAVFDLAEQFVIDRLGPAGGRFGGMQPAARLRGFPHLLGDPVHVDGEADPAIANQRNPKFLLPHRAGPSRMALRNGNCVPYLFLYMDRPWQRPSDAISVRLAAGCRTAGRASAPIARNGTRWSRMRRRACFRQARPVERRAGRSSSSRSTRRAKRCSAARPACRIRPRAGRRAGPGCGDPDGRRSGNRQVDAAAAGRGQARRRTAPTSSMSAARKRPGRCACAPNGSAMPRRRSGSPRRPRCAIS